MKPIEFKEQNYVIAKDQPEYMPLPAYVEKQDPTGRMTFCWQLSWLERIQVLFTGCVWHQTLTFGNLLQPQLLSVQKPVFGLLSISTKPKRDWFLPKFQPKASK
jgi:hypothetical protein